MDTWNPPTESELQDLIRVQLSECSSEQQSLFERYKTPLRKAPIIRYGRTEFVFIVAQRNEEAMYYEDVEEGFNFSPLDSDGSISQHWCNQDRLNGALSHWLDSTQQYLWYSPATRQGTD